MELLNIENCQRKNRNPSLCVTHTHAALLRAVHGEQLRAGGEERDDGRDGERDGESTDAHAHRHEGEPGVQGCICRSWSILRKAN